VHNAQSDVTALHTTVDGLNAQIPTFDRVVAIANELRVAKGEVSHLSTTAVDWSAVVGELSHKIPAGLGITTFTGSASNGTASAGTSAASASATLAPATGIGSINVGVSGTFPSSAHFDPVAQWIDGLSASSFFSPPGVSAVANAPAGPNTSVTFQSTLWLTPSSNLAKNAHF
jgi:hypothetical protein